MNPSRQRRVFFLAVMASAVLASSGAAAARDLSTNLAPAVNGLDRMTRDLCQSLKLKCKKSQGSHRSVQRNAAAAPAASPPRRDSAAAKPSPVPVPTPRPKAAAVEVASVEAAPDQSSVPVPRVRPAPEPAAATAAKVATAAPDAAPDQPAVPVPRVRPAPEPAAAKVVTAAPDVAPGSAPPPAAPQDKVASIAPPTAVPALSGECEQGLRNSKVQFEPVAAPFGDANCPVDDPVRLHAIATPSGLVNLPEGPVFNCRFARQFAMWISETGSAVVLAQTSRRLDKVATGPGYDCRHRNGDSSGKMSEHAAGDAVDITTLTLAGGTTIRMADAIDPASPSYAVLRALRTTACGYFTTVLGPGANEAHKEHYHLDLGVHGKSGNYRICE